MTTLTHARAAGDIRATTHRLLVTRRDPRTRLYVSLGFLTCLSSGYRFAYLRRVVDDGAQRLPGLGRRDVYESTDLFPVFAERVMSSRRPDRREAMEALGLPEDAAPFDVLVNSAGRSVGDTIELLPAPEAAPDGSLGLDFLVHGVRHMTPQAQDRISMLRAGETLVLEPEPGDPANPRAQLVTDTDRERLGYVPDPLISVLDQMHGPRLSVVRANGAGIGFHFRLAARAEGTVDAGNQPFDGPEWATA